MPFRRFYILKRDDMILKVLMNCFNAVKDVFPEYWRSPNNNILWKSTGFGGIIKSLNDLILLGIKDKTLTKDFFVQCFKCLKSYLDQEKIYLTSEFFPGGGEQQQRRLADFIRKANEI